MREKFLLFVVSLLSMLPSQSHAVESDYEYKVKTAYIYNVIKYIHWPEELVSSKQQLKLCVWGSGPVATMLNNLEGRLVQDMSIKLVRLSNGDQLPECHALYLAQSEEKQLGKHLARLDKQTITISDISSFVDHHGMVGFAIEGDRIRIEINMDQIRQQGVEVSAQLLEVARIIRY